MTARRWRGTIVYVGSVVALGAAALTRFGGVLGTAATDAGTTSGAATAASGATGGSSTPSDAGKVPSQGVSPASPGAGTADPAQVTVTGDVAQTRYGPVQVAVTFTGAHIDTVTTMQAPSGGESSQISSRATPTLAQEAVRSQSSSIDTVSGATYTSEGYRESLQSAIDARG